MKIPGTVIEMLGYSWIPAMKLLRRISKTQWPEIAGIGNIIEMLQSGAKPAWEILSQPKVILETVLENRKARCEDNEISEIYNALKETIYETKAEVFFTTLDRQIDNISYKRNINEAKKLWTEKTKTSNIHEWCNVNNCPINWIFDGNDSVDVSTIALIQNGKQVDKSSLESALSFLERNNLAVLFDTKVISDCFFKNVGDSYRIAFETDGVTLYARLKTNSNLSTDVYSWSSKAPQIRQVLDEFLRSKKVNEAKERAKNMSTEELRDVALNILDDMPQLYTHFLKK
jgi:hypothetical protein